MSAPPRAADTAAAADSYQRGQARVAAAAAVAAIAAWRGINGKALDLSWLAVLTRLLPIVSGAQRKAAAAAPAYVGELLALQDAAATAVRLADGAFAGLTGDGRPMATLLYAPVALAKQRIGAGMRIADALAAEELHLAVLVRTQVQDAGRMGLQAAMAAEPKIRGYVRHVNLPACARCIILAGRFYRYSAGFQRHPNCDCTMIPAAGEQWVESQDPAELIAQMRDQHAAKLRRSLTEGDLKALEHGADLNQVVNAHRGMSTAAGRSITREGTTRRGFAGKRLIAEAGSRPGGRYRRAVAVRLTPAQIFDEAARLNWGRGEIVRQLTRFGYII